MSRKQQYPSVFVLLILFTLLLTSASPLITFSTDSTNVSRLQTTIQEDVEVQNDSETGPALADSDEGSAPTFSSANTKDSQLEIAWTNVSGSAGLWNNSGSFFAWGDYDSDGDPDLLVDGGSALFENQGAPTFNFVDVRTARGLPSGYSTGAWGDIDNDGDLDLILGARSDSVYLNGGAANGWNFTLDSQRTAQINDAYPTTAVVLRDVNQDGWLDLYVANGEDWNDGNPVYYRDYYYLGSATSGFIDASSQLLGDQYYARGVSFGDTDRDGDADLYVGNYRIVANRYYDNQDGVLVGVSANSGDSTEILEGTIRTAGGPSPYWGHTIASAFADMDNDGFPEILSANLVHLYYDSSDSRGLICDDSHFYRQSPVEGETWDTTRPDNGITYGPRGGSGVYQGDELYAGVAVADVDNDGDLDMWLPQIYNLAYATAELWINDGNMQFTNKAGAWGLDVIDTYGGAFADIDGDGDMDLITGGRDGVDEPNRIHLFRNDGLASSPHTSAGNWLEIEVNTSAIGSLSPIGTTIEVYQNNSLLAVRTIAGAEGPHASSTFELVHFGFANNSDTVDILAISQSGNIQWLSNQTLNQRIELTFQPSFSESKVSLSSNTQQIIEGDDFVIDFNAVSNWTLDVGIDGILDSQGNTGGLSQSQSYSQSHALPNSGKQVIRLLSWNESTGGGRMETISVFGIERIPLLNLTLPSELVPGVNLTFSLNESHDASWDLTNMEWLLRWDAPGGVWTSNPTLSIVVDNPGTYNLSIGVRDHKGNTVTRIEQIVIAALPPQPQIILQTEAVMDELVGLSMAVVNDSSNTNNIDYFIDWGDGQSTNWAANSYRTHRWTSPGIFIVNVTARNGWGIQNYTTHLIEIINLNPVINWTLVPNVAYLGIDSRWEVSTTDSTTDQSLLNIIWEADGLEISNDSGPTLDHQFDLVGIHYISATVTDPHGEQAQIGVNVSVSTRDAASLIVVVSDAVDTGNALWLNDRESRIVTPTFSIGNDWVLTSFSNISLANDTEYRLQPFIAEIHDVNHVSLTWHSPSRQEFITWQREIVYIFPRISWVDVNGANVEILLINDSLSSLHLPTCTSVEISYIGLPLNFEVKWEWGTLFGRETAQGENISTSMAHQSQILTSTVSSAGYELEHSFDLQGEFDLASDLWDSSLVGSVGGCIISWKENGNPIDNSTYWYSLAMNGEHEIQVKVITTWLEVIEYNRTIQINNSVNTEEDDEGQMNSIDDARFLSSSAISIIGISGFLFLILAITALIMHRRKTSDSGGAKAVADKYSLGSLKPQTENGVQIIPLPVSSGQMPSETETAPVVSPSQAPSPETEATLTHLGYEWFYADEDKWYRIEGSGSNWTLATE